MEFSTNELAEVLFGRRPDNVMPFDGPAELGYWCPVCQVEAYVPEADGFNERLWWSEYNGFIWCETCNKDYPSALCVPFTGPKWKDDDWVHRGADDAIDVFLRTVQDAVRNALVAIAPAE